MLECWSRGRDAIVVLRAALFVLLYTMASHRVRYGIYCMWNFVSVSLGRCTYNGCVLFDMNVGVNFAMHALSHFISRGRKCWWGAARKGQVRLS